MELIEWAASWSEPPTSDELKYPGCQDDNDLNYINKTAFSNTNIVNLNIYTLIFTLTWYK